MQKQSILVLAVVVTMLAGSLATAEILQVLASNSYPTYTTSSLENGQKHQIDVSGVFIYDIYQSTTKLADAEWQRKDGGEWVEFYGETGHPQEGYYLDLLVNESAVDWMGTTDGVTFALHTYSPSHIYQINIFGTGEVATFRIADIPYYDNSGYLTVEITEVPEPAIGDLLVSRTGYDRVSQYDGITRAYLGDFVSPGYGGLDGPWGITFGPDGNLYVASEETDTILRYNGETGLFIDEFATSTSPCARTILFGPDGNLYVADECLDAVFRYDGQTGNFVDIFTSGYNPDRAFGMAFGPDGNLYVSDDSTSVVRFNGTTGQFIDVFATGPPIDGPAGLIFGPDGNLYVADRWQNKVKRYNGHTGAFIDDFVTSGSGGLSNAEGTILFGPDGNLYVASHNSARILRYDGQTGDFIDEFAFVTQVTFFVFVPEPTVGDYIDWADLAAFCDRWLDNGCSDANYSYWCVGADIDRSGDVDFADFDWLGCYWLDIPSVPNAASSPNPNDLATNVSITGDLSWIAGTDTAAHGVYFGTNPTIEPPAAGYVVAWGDNSHGQLNTPVGDFTVIAARHLHSLSLRPDGSIVAWGNNEVGQCNVPDNNGFVAIAAGGQHSLALKPDGSIAAWGNNTYSQCNTPPGNFAAIAAGDFHSLALESNGSLVAWGNNEDGKCDVPAGNDFVRISAGEYHSLALKEDGSLVAWGNNTWGQCDVPEGDWFVDIAAGNGHSLALKSDGSIAAWGDNTQGQCNVPIGMDFTAIAAYADHSLALKSDGSLVAWGWNTQGQCDVPSGNNYVAIATGRYHSVALVAEPTPDANEFQGYEQRPYFAPGILDANTTYYWRINEVGLGGTTTGAVWNFTTAPVPGQASSPNPTDTEIDVNLTPVLSWLAGSDTTSHDVYFGTTAPGDFQGNQTVTTFDPCTLQYETTYYWRIDEVGPGGTTTGAVWSFTTMIDPNIVGRWWLDETTGNIAYDSSGNENHGTLFDGIGDGLVWEPNEGALNFDGSNKLSRVVIPTTGMTTTAGTVAIWANLAEPQIRGDGRTGQAYFFGCDNGGINKILLYMSNSDTQLDMKIGNHGENNLLTLSTETWYHIALTWNAGTYAIYVDGSPLDTGTYTGLSSLPSTADIGNNGDSHTQSLHGLMGEVQVYDKALPADEIQELYQAGPN